MAKITRIKASDHPEPKEEAEERPPITRKTVTVPDKKAERTQAKEARAAKKAERRVEREKSGKKTFILFRPFVALGRYLRDAWKEIRQVRWPNRKVTWKMVLAVIVYTVIFVALISLLDLFFGWLIGLILNR